MEKKELPEEVYLHIYPDGLISNIWSDKVIDGFECVPYIKKDAAGKFVNTPEWLNCEVKSLKEQVERLREKNKELEANAKNAETDKLQYAKKYFQDRCHHDWGGVTWTWCCGGYRTCRICGKTEDYYERD